MDKPKIGWIGLGNMGTPMVKNLLKADYSVSIYNRTKSKAEALKSEGGKVAESPKELAEKCDIIISMVANDDAVKDIYLGEKGVAKAAKPKAKLAIDMSTVSPDMTNSIAAALEPIGISYMDAPVSGSVKPAEEGKLIILAGGKKDDYEKVKPIFDHLGKRSILLGDLGSGNTTKLGVNLLIGFHTQGLAESIAFMKQKGIDIKSFLEIVNNGAMANVLTKVKGENILNDEYKASFSLKHLAKDLRLARNQGMKTPGGMVLEETYQQAAETKLADEDMIAIIKYFE